ncbi:hypothetical protein BDN67DRAFT_8000 [Paxillus ammoniavirescens]|nr:hypothetical protein BDN67DRAFT_8000 [Paxillus ammoniavirescens]
MVSCPYQHERILLNQEIKRDDCDAQVNGFAGAVYKKLNTEAEAREFIAAKSTVAITPGSADALPIPSTSRHATASDPKMVTKAVETAKDEIDCDIVYCDGACKGNGQVGSVAGVGVWWGHGDPRYVFPVAVRTALNVHIEISQSGVQETKRTTGLN